MLNNNQFLKGYCNNYQLKFSNPLLASFLQVKENACLLSTYIDSNNNEHLVKLENNFLEHYVEIRYLSFCSKLIRYYAQNYSIKLQNQLNIYSLILDQPISETETITMIDSINGGETLEEHFFKDRETLLEHISDKKLYDGLCSLTENQLNILNLSVIGQLKDTEIAKLLGISQQSVSKSHKIALQNLKNYLIRGESNGTI